MIRIKSPAELARMRVSGGLAALVCEETAGRVAPGVTTGELDAFAEELIRKRGALSAFKGYRGFPGHICVSVNEQVVHGIPGSRRIRQGDLVSLDVGVIFDGFVGDTARTVIAGATDAEALRLVTVTEQALAEGIAMARAGGRLSDIGHAVEKTATAAGYSVVRDFVGHGIGRTLHEDPQIPNFGPPGRGPALKPGMTLAIEPMVNGGAFDVDVTEDGWTVVTRDGSLSAHAEHTVAILEDGPEILTRRENAESV